MSNENEVLKAIFRESLTYFSMKVFNEVSANDKYHHNWHIEVICDKLTDVLEGKEKRLIINIPPRYMKSIICSVAFPAFILGKNPKARIIAVSYSDDLTSNLALKCKQVMESSWYQDIFPDTKLSKNKKSTNDFETTRGGGRYATSVNGTLTGRGADYIIIDDPIKPDDANSDTIREKTNNWYGSTLYSRLNNKNEGKIIVIMQRLHDEDFTGYLLKTDSSFKHIKIPAIAEKDEIWTIRDRITGKEKIITRKKNTPLHPQMENIEKLKEAQENMGQYSFSGQYQQNPAPREGGIIKEAWLQYYNKEELFHSIANGHIKIRAIVQSWDTASKIEQHNDYSACVTAIIDEDNVNYILDIYKEKLEFPDLIRKVVQKHNFTKEKYKNSINVLIEDQSSGTSLIQELKTNYNIYPQEIKPEYDKKTRLIAVSYLIENGKCLFPGDKPDWWFDFEQELVRFPKVKHDDQVDALTQLLSQSVNYAPNPFIRLMKDRMNPKNSKNPRMDLLKNNPQAWLEWIKKYE